MILGLIVSIIVSICLAIYCYQLKQDEAKIVRINIAKQQENEQIEQANQRLINENRQLESNRNILGLEVNKQNNLLRSLSETRAKMEADAETAAQKLYESKVAEIEEQAIQRQRALAAEYEVKATALSKQYDKASQELKDIQDKQLAYIQARQREQEIELQQDYYRLVLSEDDQADIQLLRQIQSKIKKNEVIDKVIYENFFRVAYNILISHICNSTAKISGIYKITSLKTGQIYIGQSVDIKERLKTHIKTGLSSAVSTNKLYKAMKKEGVENFTFEILEEVPRDKLNEREIYWINFYKSKEYGLNDTRGGS